MLPIINLIADTLSGWEYVVAAYVDATILIALVDLDRF
jgi:hypothetical protein